MKPFRTSGKEIFYCALVLILGVGLLAAGMLDVLDSFWTGMGGGFLAVGAMRLVRYLRYRKNAQYRETVDTESRDERNRYLANKAWAWAGYLYVVLAAVATIVLKLVGEEKLMIAASASVCLIVLLYWVCRVILNKKY